jgi:hypothetical protein
MAPAGDIAGSGDIAGDGAVCPAFSGGNLVPQETQNRLPGGLRASHVGQVDSSMISRAVSKLKMGASGRDMRPPGEISVGISAGSGITPSPVGGVGGTTPVCETSRRPQSWQNARLSGLLRPQRSQITPPKGNPQVPVASSGFPGERAERPRLSTSRHASRDTPTCSCATRGQHLATGRSGTHLASCPCSSRPIRPWAQELFPIP